jgi:hypothetical protein
MPRKTRKRRTHRTSPEDPAQLLQLAALGRHTLCDRIAGRCTSELASLLKDWRDEKRYKAYCSCWSEFCIRYLNTTRSEADKLIRMWEQYGDAFFRLAAVTRITAETFRHIAHTVKEGTLCFGGQVLPLLPEYAEEINKAVAVLRSRIPRRLRGNARLKSSAALPQNAPKMPAALPQSIDIPAFTSCAK